jgi:hypothetical protein
MPFQYLGMFLPSTLKGHAHLGMQARARQAGGGEGRESEIRQGEAKMRAAVEAKGEGTIMGELRQEDNLEQGCNEKVTRYQCHGSGTICSVPGFPDLDLVKSLLNLFLKFKIYAFGEKY